MQKVVSYLTLILLVFLSNIAVADSVYLNTLSLVDNIASIFFAIAYIVGAAFAFMGLVYYRRFRQNANETPLSKVLWTFMLGVLLFLFPLAAQQLDIYQTISSAEEQTSGQ